MLTNEQEKVLYQLQSSKEPILILSAPAGTGKSFTLSHWIKDEQRSIALTTTTHKALDNLFEMSGDIKTKFVGTIHSFLGYTIQYSGTEQVLVKRKNHTQECVDILIVDEYSMLTKQLLKAIESFVSNDMVKKVVLVGDSNQLMLEGYIKRIKYPMLTLTKQMRQKNGSMLHKYLDDLRNQILTGGYRHDNRLECEEVVRYNSHSDFITAYKECISEKIILGFQNQTVKHYNRNITKHLHKKNNEYNINDVLVLREPYSDLLRNNERVTVLNVVESEHWFTLLVQSKKHKCEFKTPKTTSWLKEHLQQYVDKKNWNKYYEEREQFVAVHHCYALTVHKSQGSTYDEVFVDVKDILTANTEDDIYRMMYVAMSRARHKIHLFVGEERDYGKFK
jgi:ATP-dependent exoDNAse (exonuclease V) alpha subunit